MTHPAVVLLTLLSAVTAALPPSVSQSGAKVSTEAAPRVSYGGLSVSPSASLISTYVIAISILHTASFNHTVSAFPKSKHDPCGPTNGANQAGPDALLNTYGTVTLVGNGKQDTCTVTCQDDLSGKVLNEISCGSCITDLNEENGSKLESCWGVDLVARKRGFIIYGTH